MDVGGASAQIAFEPTSKMSLKHSEDLRLVSLRDGDGKTKSYPIFVTIFLGFGRHGIIYFPSSSSIYIPGGHSRILEKHMGVSIQSGKSDSTLGIRTSSVSNNSINCSDRIRTFGPANWRYSSKIGVGFVTHFLRYIIIIPTKAGEIQILF